jgi:hypothetical protein
MAIVTNRQIKKSPTDKDQWLTDDAPKGYGRLTVRITPPGDRLFYFRYTDPNSKRVTVAIGKYCDQGRDESTLAMARVKAGELAKVRSAGSGSALPASNRGKQGQAHIPAPRLRAPDMRDAWRVPGERLDLLTRRDIDNGAIVGQVA